MVSDSVKAYDDNAREFLKNRDQSTIGIVVVEQWAHSLPIGSPVLEIACGGGIPITRTLAIAGLKLWAVDSSPTLLSEFQVRFPDIPVDCSDALESDYFNRKFNGVISIGLMFLLSEEEQIALIQKVSQVLSSGGRFLFTAPLETGTWTDINTGHQCRSLGQKRYESILRKFQFRILDTYEDEGRNNYYDVERPNNC